MKAFTTKRNNILKMLAVAAFWLAVWQIASMIVGEELFLSSPISVAKKLFFMLGDATFYRSLLNSFLRITLGFLLSVVAGVLLAVASYVLPFFRTLFYPLSSVMKATPVASFTILAIILFGSKNLSTPIAFVMVLPVIYTNTLAGIDNTGTDILEMASVFDISFWRKLKYIILPAVIPFFISGSSVGIGMAWKSGVAAEVIGLSANTLGKKVYETKIYLDIPELFAYTLVIIVVSVVFEKLFLWLLRVLERKIETGGEING